MRGARLIFAAALVMGILGAVALAVRARAMDDTRTIRVDDLARKYMLHVPTDLPPGRRIPVVLVFHGGGGHDWSMPNFTHFDALADDEGFIVAYPDSTNRYWNDGRNESSADDVGFVRALIDDLEHTYPVDPHRVYATGISNGGFFSNRLACDLTDKIAAIASVAATMPEDLAPVCKPSRPISVLYMHGTLDPLVPIGGGKVGFVHGRSRGMCISLDAASKFWRENDQTSSMVRAAYVQSLSKDSTRVERKTWSGGKDGTEVVVYTIEGGGHTWPGGPQYLPVFLVGKASQNLDATRTIWEFFKTKSLP